MSLQLLTMFVLATGAADAMLTSTQSFVVETANTTPIAKVTELLKGLQTKIIAEGKVEAAEYDKFACWCKEQANDKQYAIQEETVEIDDLGTSKAAEDTKGAALNGEITSLVSEMTGRTIDIAQDKAGRKRQYDDYTAANVLLEGSITACAGAIKEIKGAKGNLKNAKLNLLELNSQLMHSATRIFGAHPTASLVEQQKANTLIELDLKEMQKEKQAPHKFAFSGNAIIASLETLLANFKKLKANADMDEIDAKAMYEKQLAGNNNENKFDGKEKAEKSSLEAATVETSNTLGTEKEEEEKDRAADERFLVKLTESCEAKAQVFDQRSTTRAGELSALTQAIAELEGDVKTNEGANKKLVGLVQRAPSFLQLSSQEKNQKRAVRKVQELLQEAAQVQHSGILRAAAARVRVSGDHFVKVRGLIGDLLAKLRADAADEVQSKGFCDSNMISEIGIRDSNQATKETANSRIATLTAWEQKLTNELATLAANIAASKKGLSEATELRGSALAGTGSAGANAATIAMATDGKASVDKALLLLSTFYGVLIQVHSEKYVPPNSDRNGNTVADLAPKTAATDYQGAQAESKGIIGMLEVISADFDRTIEEVGKEEQNEEDEFRDIIKGGDDGFDAEISTLEGSVGDKDGLLKTAKLDLIAAKGELKDAKELYGGALDSLESLKASCVDGEETYEERVAKRQKEIASLKDAMEVFNSWQK